MTSSQPSKFFHANLTTCSSPVRAYVYEVLINDKCVCGSMYICTVA